MAGFLVYFRAEASDLDAAARVLAGYKLAVSRDGELLTVGCAEGREFRIGLSAEPWVRGEAAEIGEGTPYAEALNACDRRFDVGFHDLDEVLDEYGTLQLVQEALLEASGGIIFLEWNGNLIGPANG